MAIRLDKSAYTVGWICALPVEYTAAQEFLDQEHLPLDENETEERDDNHYTLGSIGKHNVVVAVLPSGEYGTATAASVAKDLVRSFPNVRIGLMVGIGGGAPSEDVDIRLGDIVVSTASDGHSGVFQYDFGKTVQEREFQYTRSMNQPPAVLRAAVSGLRSRYERKGNGIDVAVKEALSANKRLRKKYGKPDRSSDLLFNSDYLHQGGLCENACAQLTATIVQRPPRDQDEDELQIHYGLIASANSLMKDALLRDRLIRDRNVLCFEMEAGGLMNSFPCLVIRGICDYSDSHKNKKWQGYAAMAAAAYAKALCLELKPTAIEREQKILDVVSEVRQATTAANAGVRELRSNMQAHENRRVLDWLSTEDYGAQHSDVVQNRSQGTGQWLLESPPFGDWLSVKRKTLFCPGLPGAGKTVMSSIVIDAVRQFCGSQGTIGVAFIYCNFKRQANQTLQKLLSSLLRQLCACLPSVPETVHKLFSDHQRKSTKPVISEVETTLREVLEMFDRAYIIIDALDECQSDDGQQTNLPDKILDLQETTNVSFFATSRHIPFIEKKFKGAASLEIAATSDDLTFYLKESIARLPEFVRKSDDLQSEIRDYVIAASQGMFLIAKLHVNSLVDKHNVRSLKDALRKLVGSADHPSDDNRSIVLSTAYSDILARIKGQLPGFRELAERVLMWITFARRRFTADELQAVVATKPGERALDIDNLTDTNVLISVCCGLVTLQKESNEIQLVHYTAQEYLEYHQRELLPGAFSIMADDCITHLMYDLPEDELELCAHFAFLVHDYSLEPTTIDTLDEGRPIKMETLRVYASHYWGYHFKMAEAMDSYRAPVDIFMKSEKHVLAAVVRLCRTPLFNRAPQALGPSYFEVDDAPQCASVTAPPPVLHLLSFFGILDIMWQVIEKDSASVNSRCVFKGYRSDYMLTATKVLKPLEFAMLGSQLDAMDLLISSGVSLNVEDPVSPLVFAIDVCVDASVVSLLLRRGADANQNGVLFGQTPLYHAVKANSLPIVELLIAHGADVNAVNNREESVLMKAVRMKSKDVVQCLANYGAAVGLTDSKGRSPLRTAAYRGSMGIVSILLQHGSPVDGHDSAGRTALYHALKKGYPRTAQVLLDAGASIVLHRDAAFDLFQSTCRDASREGNVELTRALEEFHPERFAEVFQM